MKKIKSHIIENKISYFWILLALLMLLILFFILIQEEKEFHIHSDFKVIINEYTINFSEKKYQSSGFNTLHQSTHLHDNNGDVIHFHADGINLPTFFRSLNIGLDDSCIVYENISYCNNQTHKLDFYINNKKIDSISSYIPNDLDQILIVYDKLEKNTQKYLNEVTDKACIESALCPQRGEPSEGSCITGETCLVDLSQIK